MLWYKRCVHVIRTISSLNLPTISTAAQLVVHGKIRVLGCTIAAADLPLLRLLLMKLFIITLSCIGGWGTRRLHAQFLLSLSVRCLVLQRGGVIPMSVHLLVFV